MRKNSTTKIILASSSPRRKELLSRLGLSFIVVPSKSEERHNPRLKPAGQAKYLSLKKAKLVAEKFTDKGVLVISADTFVVIDGHIVEKPKDAKDALRILKKLRGRRQTVITGFTILDTKTKKIVTKSIETELFMRKLSEKEMNAYIKKEHVFDKSGGYSIEGVGSIFFERIEGDYNNVLGLPLFALAQELKKFGVTVL